MANEPTILEMNRTICEFTGWEFKLESDDWYMAYYEGRKMWADNKKGLDRILLEGFRYHDDWNKLMPVVEKIPKLIHAEEDLGMRREMSSRWKPIQNELCNVNIINVHYCVYQFIRWSNEALATPVADHGMCVRCKVSKATTDYNGYGYWVCFHCDEILNDEFEDEYK